MVSQEKTDLLPWSLGTNTYRMGQSRFTFVSMRNTEFILVLLFIHYCIASHTNNCNLLLSHPVQYRKDVDKKQTPGHLRLFG